MTALIVWGIILAYFGIGFGLGRRVFVNVLGDADRIDKKKYSNYTHWTLEFTSAVWWSIFTVMLWPIFGPARLMFSATPYEKLQNQERKVSEIKKDLRRLSREFDLKELEF